MPPRSPSSKPQLTATTRRRVIGVPRWIRARRRGGIRPRITCEAAGVGRGPSGGRDRGDEELESRRHNQRSCCHVGAAFDRFVRLLDPAAALSSSCAWGDGTAATEPRHGLLVVIRTRTDFGGDLPLNRSCFGVRLSVIRDAGRSPLVPTGCRSGTAPATDDGFRRRNPRRSRL
jgi:hypothetical protein